MLDLYLTQNVILWHSVMSPSSIIVFNSSGRVLKPFQFVYDGKPIIEMVKEFQYLGTTLSPSGSLFLAKEKLRKQAKLIKLIFQ